MGVNIDDSSIEIGDTMILAYVLGVEPRGLKDLARRHLHADMHDYKDVVGPYYAKAAVRYVARANKVDWGKPEERVVFDPKTRRSRIYRPQALNLRFAAILRSHRSSANVDYEKRWLSIPADLRAKVEDRFGPHPAWSNAISLVPVDERTRYAGTDAVVTRVLWDILWDRVRAMGLDGVARTDMSIVRMIERMERVGVPCDASALKALIPSYRAVQRSIERKVSLTYARSRPINLGSGPQVASLLYGILKLRAPRKTRRGDRGSTDKKSLEALRSEHPVIDDIRCWRIADKNRSFAEKLPNHVRDGRIHGRIKYTSVVSGRFAMEDPNLQQIPTRNEGSKEIRNAFSAPDGRLLMSNDYDQLEMKVLAHYSKDKTLLRYMRSGQDVHVKTAALLFGTDEQRVTKAQRTVTKNINYGLIYQIQEQGLHDQLKVAGVQGYSVEDCAKLIKQWFRIYPGVESFFEECRVEARRYAYVRSEWGRIRWLPNIYSPIEYMRAEAERKAISHKISATATDIIKRAMARYWTWLNEEIWPEGWYMEVVLQIHDELLTEMDAALSSEANAVRKIMMGDSNRFAVPITVGCAIGKRWGELK
jgi:DNA polymerase-1